MKAPNQIKTPAKKNIWRTVLQTALLVVIALAVGLGIYHWNAQSLGRNAMPMPFGVGIAVVVSGSMEPALSVDDLILVKESDHYTVGDVVVFSSGSSLVVHRIIELDGDTVITQGDANNTPDDPITLRDIKGKVVFTLPYVGVAVDFVKSTPGTMLILLAAAYLYWRSVQNERKENDRELDEIRKKIDELRK